MVYRRFVFLLMITGKVFMDFVVVTFEDGDDA